MSRDSAFPTRLYVRRAKTQISYRLIRVFAVSQKTLWILSYPYTFLQRFWSDCADAQANLSLHCSHTQSWRKCWVSAQMTYNMYVSLFSLLKINEIIMLLFQYYFFSFRFIWVQCSKLDVRGQFNKKKQPNLFLGEIDLFFFDVIAP